MEPKLGLLAGSGPLPGRIIEQCRRVGREVFVLAFEGEADPATVEAVPHAWARLGAAAEILATLRRNGVSTLVMAGGLRSPSLASLRPDLRGARFLAKIGMRVLGDDSLLSAVVKELEAEGFTLVGADSILVDLVAVAGIYGRHEPDAEARADVERGLAVARALGRLDIGQAVVVQQGVVLGVEALEGTDRLIERCGTLRREGLGGVLVKALKPGQEARVDLPTIGPRTVELACQAGLRGIAVEAGSALVLEKPTLVETADRLGLFVLGCPGEVVPASPGT